MAKNTNPKKQLSQSRGNMQARIEKVKNELHDFREQVKEFFKPRNKDGAVLDRCEDSSFVTRAKYFKEDKTECPYLACSYWFDNDEWMNCSRLVQICSRQQGGAAIEQLVEIKNLFCEGTASAARLRLEEERALRKLGISFVKNGMVGPFPRSEKYLEIVEIVKGIKS
uniref:Uncharacterized protein n=2 Tax=viral metagenome TaxID=1070528 RepID=A0A6M3L3Z1_9ZZZZ